MIIIPAVPRRPGHLDPRRRPRGSTGAGPRRPSYDIYIYIYVCIYIYMHIYIYIYIVMIVHYSIVCYMMLYYITLHVLVCY